MYIIHMLFIMNLGIMIVVNHGNAPFHLFGLVARQKTVSQNNLHLYWVWLPNCQSNNDTSASQGGSLSWINAAYM